MKSRTRTLKNHDRRFFFAACSLMLVLFVAYVYFVAAAVAHVVVRKELDRKISAVEANISDLEAAYITAKDTVALDDALARGFVENDDKVFVVKLSDSVALSRHETR